MFNPNPAFLLVQKLKGFTPGVKAEIEKTFSICPKLLINGELYGLVLASRLKTGYLQPSPWGQCSSIY